MTESKKSQRRVADSDDELEPQQMENGAVVAAGADGQMKDTAVQPNGADQDDASTANKGHGSAAPAQQDTSDSDAAGASTAQASQQSSDAPSSSQGAGAQVTDNQQTTVWNEEHSESVALPDAPSDGRRHPARAAAQRAKKSIGAFADFLRKIRNKNKNDADKSPSESNEGQEAVPASDPERLSPDEEQEVAQSPELERQPSESDQGAQSPEPESLQSESDEHEEVAQSPAPETQPSESGDDDNEQQEPAIPAWTEPACVPSFLPPSAAEVAAATTGPIARDVATVVKNGRTILQWKKPAAADWNPHDPARIKMQELKLASRATMSDHQWPTSNVRGCKETPDEYDDIYTEWSRRMWHTGLVGGSSAQGALGRAEDDDDDDDDDTSDSTYTPDSSSEEEESEVSASDEPGQSAENDETDSAESDLSNGNATSQSQQQELRDAAANYPDTPADDLEAAVILCRLRQATSFFSEDLDGVRIQRINELEARRAARRE